MLDAIAADTTNDKPPAVKPATGDEILIKAAARYRAATRAEDRANAAQDRATEGTADYQAALKMELQAWDQQSEAEAIICNTPASGLHGVMIQLEHTHFLNTKDGMWQDDDILQPACRAFKTLSALTGITSRECLGVFAECRKNARKGWSCFCADNGG
jgi:hypothetical protein